MAAGHSLLSGDYYLPGLLIRGSAFALSFLGVFLGLRCASTARALAGGPRLRWLLLGGVSAGGVGVWAADFTGLLGLQFPGHTVRYSAPVTVGCLAAGAAVLAAGLIAAGPRPPSTARLAVTAVLTGLGITLTHYLEVAAIRVPARVSYRPGMAAVSAVLAILAAAVVLLAAARLRGIRSALGAALIAGVAVSGMRDAGTAAVHLTPAAGPAGMVLGAGSGVTAAGYLLPLIIGLGIGLFGISWAVALAPDEEAVRYDESLLDRIRGRSTAPLTATPLATDPLTAGGPAAQSSPPWTFAELRKPPSAPG